MTIRLRSVKVVAGFVTAFVITARAGHYVVSVEVALAFG